MSVMAIKMWDLSIVARYRVIKAGRETSDPNGEKPHLFIRRYGTCRQPNVRPELYHGQGSGPRFPCPLEVDAEQASDRPSMRGVREDTTPPVRRRPLPRKSRGKQSVKSQPRPDLSAPSKKHQDDRIYFSVTYCLQEDFTC